MGGRRNPWRDAAALTLLCLFAYFTGLTSHGLTNWQEARRAQVAREMYAAGEWLVPTYFGEPYIAKPPMIYWAQMAIGKMRVWSGATPFEDETELRLTVAIAGLLGVLTTYFAARRLLHDRFDPRLGDDAAWLAALGLAGGVLYARSSRIGELDVVTVPFVVAAIAAVHHAWKSHAERSRAAWGAVALATACAVGAAMTKGPPALLVIVIGGYLPILHAASRSVTGRFRREALSGLIGAVVVAGAAALLAPRLASIGDWLGLVFFAGVGAIAGVALVRCAQPAIAREWFAALSRTHPLAVLGVPLLAVWLWGRLVGGRIGGDTVTALAGTELEDNLRVLVLDSPAKNIGFMLYGVAPISLAMIAGFIWLARERPRLEAGQRIPAIWCAGGLVAFSTLGKGVARYLTPVWPGVAMLGGLWLARALRNAERSLGHQRLRHGAVAVLIGAVLIQGWWYGRGREIYYPARSPRSFMRELLLDQGGAELATWRLDEPALDFYARTRLPIVEEPADLLSRAERAGGLTLIGRASDASQWVSAALDAGFSVRGIEVRAPYRWRSDRQRVAAWRIARTPTSTP